MNNNLELIRIKQVIEVCLLTANSPLSVEQIALAFEKQVEISLIEKIIFNLSQEYAEKGLELIRLSNGYRVRSKVEFQTYLNKIYQVKPPKYSQSIMETITIIAYKQPITRGEIEEIRGVTLNSSSIQTLFDREWIEVIGTKEVPGRPELLATTNKFLDDLGIISLQELPPIPTIDNAHIEQ
ncbi:MAG: SMC-Scp complex subunit ScpB [Proteobacteria bacterium]|jgi:segregation and condensation protein B|nr:SMC-Scp complex subunit ScpB [Pseudomonadota bacterium]